MLRVLILLSIVFPSAGFTAKDGDIATSRPASDIKSQSTLMFELGGGVPALQIPRAEKLEFGVHVAVGPVGATVGTVVLESGVDPYVESLVLLSPARSPEGQSRETGWLRAKAKGGYLWYDMETVLDSRYLPKSWPSISHFYRQSGSENRRRENMIGFYQGRGQTTYRGDTRHGAPSGKRIWKPLEYRDVPAGTVDMLGAVYLARTLLQSGKQKLVFPLLDRKKLWEMSLERGEEKRIEVPFGNFDAVEIKLIPNPWPGEPKVESQKFRGLFGIRGSIHLWVERETGVPIRIQGDLPAGPVTIKCDIYLEHASGTPDAFNARAVAEEDPGNG